MNDEQVTLGEWIVTMLLMMIPLVNIILLFIWAFGSGTKFSKATWAKANLVMMAIGIVIWVLFMVLFGSSVAMMGA